MQSPNAGNLMAMGRSGGVEPNGTVLGAEQPHGLIPIQSSPTCSLQLNPGEPLGAAPCPALTQLVSEPEPNCF